MPALQPVRGTHDLLPDEMRRHRQVTETAREIAQFYGYQFMATPVFEFTEVFERTLGEASDVVTKEMYTFAMKEGERITLRPENTASVVRAMLSGGLLQSLPLKYFYAGPMFRHERPQKGRQRQFHQIGIELLGVAEAMGDVEIIACGADTLEALGLLEQSRLELNTLGDMESRQAYRAALVAYFRDHWNGLSEESRERLERNPLRILDSKQREDRGIVAGAPEFQAFLNPASQDFFAIVRDGLETLGIAYELNPHLVRGLDYYCHTAFEFKTDRLGAQDTLMGGGRYDGLVETMGGPPTPGVGWAAGIERMALLLSEPDAARRPFAIVPIGAQAERLALKIAHVLRRSGLTVDLGYGGNLKKRMQRANRINARAAILIGEEELAQEAATVKDLETGAQELISLEALAERLRKYG